MDLSSAVANYFLNGRPTEDLPQIARDALEQGFQGPAVLQMASFEKPTYFQISDILSRFLSELGMKFMTLEEAGLFLAKKIASQIVEGKIDPLEGADQIGGLFFKADYPQVLEKFAVYEMMEPGLIARLFKGKSLRKEVFQAAQAFLEERPGK